MTVDGTRGEPGRPPRSTTRDLERYTGLFARRTQGLRSSAMRDLMAITASAGDHLARRWTARHEHLPARAARLPDAHGQRGGVRTGAPVRADGGLDEVKACIVEVMAEEDMRVDPDDLLATAGGQQVIDLVCRTLLDPGDVVIAEDPTYPGARGCGGSGRSSPTRHVLDADGSHAGRFT